MAEMNETIARLGIQPMTTFHMLLRQYVEESMLARKEIAAGSNITTSYLAMLLSGKRIPTRDVVQALARTLNLDASRTELLLQAAQAPRDVAKKSKIPHIDGITKVHDALPENMFNEWIAQATDRVWMLDTWIEGPIRYKDSLLEAVQQRAFNPDFNIRVLLLDPRCESAKQRSKDLWLSSKPDAFIQEQIEQYVPDSIQVSLRNFQLMFMSILDDLEKRQVAIDSSCVELRTHSHLPSMSVYLCDNRAFMGFYIHGKFANVVPQIEVHQDPSGTKRSKMFRLIESEFSNLWNVSKPVV